MEGRWHFAKSRLDFSLRRGSGGVRGKEPPQPTNSWPSSTSQCPCPLRVGEERRHRHTHTHSLFRVKGYEAGTNWVLQRTLHTIQHGGRSSPGQPCIARRVIFRLPVLPLPFAHNKHDVVAGCEADNAASSPARSNSAALANKFETLGRKFASYLMIPMLLRPAPYFLSCLLCGPRPYKTGNELYISLFMRNSRGSLRYAPDSPQSPARLKLNLISR